MALAATQVRGTAIGSTGAFLVLCGVVNYGWKVATRHQTTNPWKHVNALIGSYIVVLYVLYLYLVKTALDIFDCRGREDGSSYLDALPSDDRAVGVERVAAHAPDLVYHPPQSHGFS